MRLKTCSFIESKGTPQEWVLDKLGLGPRNLIVGKNASGKSRTLAVIANLARQFIGAPQHRVFGGEYDVEFDHEGKPYNYKLSYREDEVLSETLTIDSKVVLDRGEGGVGTILYEKEGDQVRSFQTPTTQLESPRVSWRLFSLSGNDFT